MASIQVEGEIPAPLDDVWKIVSDFGGFLEARGIPVEVEGQGIGALRKLMLGSSVLIERLESIDEDSHSTSYSVVEGPLPAKDYLGIIRVEAAGDSTTRIVWSSTFEAAGEMSEADLAEIITGAYRRGIKGLQRHFGG
ncbi:MAG TPA: SRPBCC family protein [Acidimicrobiales bacterium]|nr:SRPBCC family protein [Acidimicrobiales bacterium]